MGRATTTCSSSFRRRRRRPPFFPLLLVMIFPRMRPPPPLPARPRTKGGEIALKSETQYLSPLSNSYIVSERADDERRGRRRGGGERRGRSTRRRPSQRQKKAEAASLAALQDRWERTFVLLNPNMKRANKFARNETHPTDGRTTRRDRERGRESPDHLRILRT